MQVNMIASFKLPVSGWVAAACGAAIIALAGCSPKSPETTVPDAGTTTPANSNAAPDADLLLRVCFAGTARLLAETNVTYFTNLAALPETAALGQRLVERMATLPVRILNSNSTNTALAKNLSPIFSHLLQQGFALELHGDSNGVNSMILSAPEAALAPDQLRDALGGGFGDRSSVQSAHGWTIWTVGGRPLDPPSSILHPQALPAPPAVLAVDLASTLLPNPVRESVYGGFKRFSFTAVPTPNGFKILGKANYPEALPALLGAVVVPTNLVTEPETSLTMVRNPLGWLPPKSPIRNFLPLPAPEVLWFWGGDSSPYEFFVAAPAQDGFDFTNSFVPRYIPTLEKLAAASDSGPVVFDAEQGVIRWGMGPFCAPQISCRSVAGKTFIVAEVFPSANFTPGMSLPLAARVISATNAVLFDWEFTSTRIDTWFRLGQLALLMANHKQLAAEAPATKWLLKAAAILPGGGNMFTEITQTGSRELSLNRLAPVGFSSLELFWLANWLESENFPAANFLVPAHSPIATPEPEQTKTTE